VGLLWLIEHRRYLFKRDDSTIADDRKYDSTEPFLAAGVEPAVAVTAVSGQIVIVIGRDRRVIVDAGVDAAALARVLQVLERR
jgi:hypothetical protein